MHTHSSRVGIFYVIGVDPYIESMPMSEGEDWGISKRIQKVIWNIGRY